MRFAFLLFEAPSSVASPMDLSIWKTASTDFFHLASASPGWCASSNFVNARIGETEVDELALELLAPGQARDHVSSPSIKSEGKHFTN